MSRRAGVGRTLFDLWSYVYDAPLVQRLVYRPEQDAVLAVVRAGGCRTVLDIGCGTGLLAARLRAELPGARVVGCDFSPGMLARARARDARGPWVRGDAQRLPFRAAAFDAVVSTEAFHWFPDQGAALRELARVLRPGGWLAVTVVSPPVAAVGHAFEAGGRVLGQPFHWPTANELTDAVTAAGLRLERQRWVLRVPGAFLLPPVLTVARRP